MGLSFTITYKEETRVKPASRTKEEVDN